MDRQSLLQLAEGGLVAYPPAALGDLADWCWDYSEATGDARFCSLARALSLLVELFEYNSGVPLTLVNELDPVLRQGIQESLNARLPQHGAQLARNLRETLIRIIDSFQL